MSKFAHRANHLVWEIIPPALFFFVTFQLLALTHVLMLRRYGIDVTTFVIASLGVLVAAMVVVLVDRIPFINRYPGKPIIGNVVWKTFVYFSIVVWVHYFGELFRFYCRTGDLASAWHTLMQEIIWPRVWAIQIWLLVLMLIYSTMDELVRALGRHRVRELFLGGSGKAAAGHGGECDAPYNKTER